MTTTELLTIAERLELDAVFVGWLRVRAPAHVWTWVECPQRVLDSEASAAETWAECPRVDWMLQLVYAARFAKTEEMNTLGWRLAGRDAPRDLPSCARDEDPFITAHGAEIDAGFTARLRADDGEADRAGLAARKAERTRQCDAIRDAFPWPRVEAGLRNLEAR